MSNRRANKKCHCCYGRKWARVINSETFEARVMACPACGGSAHAAEMQICREFVDQWLGKQILDAMKAMQGVADEMKKLKFKMGNTARRIEEMAKKNGSL